jgi:hypothetical protein
MGKAFGADTRLIKTSFGCGGVEEVQGSMDYHNGTALWEYRYLPSFEDIETLTN